MGIRLIQQILELYIERWEFFRDLIIQHLRLSFSAILAAGFLGLLLGIAISENKKTADFIIGIVNIIYTVPSISMLGFLMPFTGIGDKTAIIALTVYGLLPIVRNTYTGISNLPPSIIEAARGMGSTKWQILYKIKFPLALPVIISGVRSMVVMTISISGIAAFIGAGGLGVAVYRGITTNNAVMTFAGSILIAAVAFSADFLLGTAEKSLRKKWRMS